MYDINICFVLNMQTKIFVYLAIFFYNYLFLLLFIFPRIIFRKSILHPVSQNCKIIWSWDKIGIEYTGSQLDPNFFFHLKPQPTTPWVFVDTYINNPTIDYLLVNLNFVTISRFIDWDGSEGIRGRDKTIMILVLSHDGYL